MAGIMTVALGMLSSCTNYDWTNTHDTVLSGFEIITNDVDYDAADENARDLLIEWTPATTNDHTLVFYKVLFSTTADMSDIFYEVEALNFGTQTSINITPKDVNIIAELGGIPQNDKGTLYWTVMANTGVVDMMSNTVHTITVNRPDGFAYSPDHLFVETPEGEFLTMKKQETGRFELFTILGNGEYKITERMEGGKTRNFSVSNDKLVQGGTIKSVKSGEVTHIVADFNTSKGTLAAVNSVALLYQGQADSPVDLPRVEGKGAMWQGNYHFTRVGNTYTYKFVVDETTLEGNQQKAYFGYERTNSTSQTANSPESYFTLYNCADGGTSYCFRFGNANNFQLDKDLLITVSLNSESEDDRYFHTVEVM